jgi:hypothetical protein
MSDSLFVSSSLVIRNEIETKLDAQALFRLQLWYAEPYKQSRNLYFPLQTL